MAVSRQYSLKEGLAMLLPPVTDTVTTARTASDLSPEWRHT